MARSTTQATEAGLPTTWLVGSRGLGTSGTGAESFTSSSGFSHRSSVSEVISFEDRERARGSVKCHPPILLSLGGPPHRRFSMINSEEALASSEPGTSFGGPPTCQHHVSPQFLQLILSVPTSSGVTSHPKTQPVSK